MVRLSKPDAPACGGADRATCEASGGRWGCGTLGLQCSCACPTGDAGCLCWRSFDCEGGCILDDGPCAPDGVGRCGEWTDSMLGCLCAVDYATERFESWCRDG